MHRLPILAAARRLARRTAARILLAALEFRIASTYSYLRRCQPDGLILSLNLRRFHADASADIARAACIRADLARGVL